MQSTIEENLYLIVQIFFKFSTIVDNVSIIVYDLYLIMDIFPYLRKEFPQLWKIIP